MHIPEKDRGQSYVGDRKCSEIVFLGTPTIEPIEHVGKQNKWNRKIEEGIIVNVYINQK